MCFCRFYYDSESNVLWCKIRKAGSTTYVSTFARVADKRLARVRHRGTWGQENKMFRLHTGNVAEVLARKPFLFAVSRHPYERLVSVFTDFSQKTGVNQEKWRVRGSFEQFLENQVLKQAESCDGVSCEVNPHWDSMDKMCSFCALNYTVLSSMDTFAEDFSHITARLGLKELAK